MVPEPSAEEIAAACELLQAVVDNKYPRWPADYIPAVTPEIRRAITVLLAAVEAAPSAVETVALLERLGERAGLKQERTNGVWYVSRERPASYVKASSADLLTALRALAASLNATAAQRDGGGL